jgi:hypothetical protein
MSPADVSTMAKRYFAGLDKAYGHEEAVRRVNEFRFKVGNRWDRTARATRYSPEDVAAYEAWAGPSAQHQAGPDALDTPSSPGGNPISPGPSGFTQPIPPPAGVPMSPIGAEPTRPIGPPASGRAPTMSVEPTRGPGPPPSRRVPGPVPEPTTSPGPPPSRRIPRAPLAAARARNTVKGSDIFQRRNPFRPAFS